MEDHRLTCSSVARRCRRTARNGPRFGPRRLALGDSLAPPLTSAAITFANFPQAPGAGPVDAVQRLFDNAERFTLASPAPEPCPFEAPEPAGSEAGDWKEICSRLLSATAPFPTWTCCPCCCPTWECP